MTRKGAILGIAVLVVGTVTTISIRHIFGITIISEKVPSFWANTICIMMYGVWGGILLDVSEK